jgi:hypothetical protein
LTGILVATPPSWSLVFELAGGIYICGAVGFSLFATARKLID